MTLGCSDDFVAVRLGFANVSNYAWRITRAIGRPSAAFNDYVTPTGDALWTNFTTANAGADSSTIITGITAPTEIEIQALDDTPLARCGRVRWTWTDWAPIRSLPADASTGMRVLMLRALVQSGQTVTYAVGQLRSFTGNVALNRGHDVLIGGLKFDIDMVSYPDRDNSVSTQTWIDNQLVTGTLFPMVQFLTLNPGITGMVAGDSHAQGTSTIEQFRGFPYLVTTSLAKDYREEIPFA